MAKLLKPADPRPSPPTPSPLFRGEGRGRVRSGPRIQQMLASLPPLLVLLVLLLLPPLSWGAKEPRVAPVGTVALFYGKPVPVNALVGFDSVVVDPASGFTPPPHSQRWLAYVSVGEVTSNREYLNLLPPSWLMGSNPEWHSRLIDQTPRSWPDFFVEQIIAPLWRQGYRGFFFDTLDSYLRVITTARGQTRQREGEIRLIHAVHRRFPQAQLVLNRGFDLLPAVHGMVQGVVVESLFRGWHASNGEYFEVAPADSQWLLGQIDQVRFRYHLPVIVVDYCPQTGPCIQQDLAAIRARALTPYITDGLLQRIGVSSSSASPHP